MDEIALLQRLQGDVPDPTPQALAAARTRLMTKVTGLTMVGEPSPRTPVCRDPQAPTTRRTTRRLVVLGAAAAAVIAVLAASTITSEQAPANAAEALARASAQVGPVNQPGPGQYLQITTRGEAMAYLVDDSGQVSGGYLYRSVDAVYLPADLDDVWVSVSFSRKPVTFYGADAEQQATREFEESATAAEPNLDRAKGGEFGNSELGGGTGGYATPQDLASLPRDPAELLDDLAARANSADTNRSVAVLTQIRTLLSSGLVDSELTSTMYETLALLPDVEITDRQASLDGREGTAIGVRDQGGFSIDEVIIDVDQGVFLGGRTRQIEAQGPIPAGTLIWSTAVASKVVDSAP